MSRHGAITTLGWTCVRQAYLAGSPVTEDEVLAFVGDVVSSVWMLELLLLLRRKPARSWEVADLVAALHANTRIVTEGLTALEAAGFVAGADGGAFEYRPASPLLAEIGEAVADLHARKPVAVVRTIVSAPKDKIQIFADAFRFKK